MVTAAKTAQSGIDSSPSHYVGIGASAGGLEAIEMFFKQMPEKTNLAFIVVQHLSPDYKSLMVELLSKKTRMQVHRAEDGMEARANNVYLIPPKKNLTIFHGKLLLNDKINVQGINLPIDIFLRSLAEDQAEKAIAVILSGTGSDGTRGVRAIKEFGGMVMVQDEESAKFDGMPRAASSTGVADFNLSPDNMPRQLLAYVSHPYVSGKKQVDSLLNDSDALTRLFAELRDKTRVDFTHYKPSTITRRIERRMSVNQIRDFEDYVRYLQGSSGEAMALYRELLIGVTSFFRDPKAMEELQDNWLPGLLQGIHNREVRFWVAGCSTGEEAYSLAIITREVMAQLGISRDIKIFATDIDKDALTKASTGVYPESVVGDLTPNHVSKYFYRTEEKLQVARNVREMVVFAQHNLIKDPPFTNIDLVSCRNLLIYLQPVLQKRAFEMFNFSLNAEGLLFLGTSETTGDMDDCFQALHQKYKIYRSKGKVSALGRDIRPQTRQETHDSPVSFVGRSRDRRHGDHESNRISRQFIELASRYYLPLSIIVNENMEIVHIVGDTEDYFKLPAGPTDYNITKLARKELAMPLSTGIQKVFRTGDDVSYSNMRIESRGEDRFIRIRVVRLPDMKGFEPLVSVFIEESDQQPHVARGTSVDIDVGDQARQHIDDLEQELQFARENLQATIEELETSNEELQATNEELLASNEELQSTNEELQSTNEELYTVNAEHQNKITELTELNNDVDNLLTSSRIGILLLDEDLEVRRFSPEISQIFRILEKDIGRPIDHIAHSLIDVNPMELIREVIDTNQRIEKQVETKEDQFYLARILPYVIGPKTYSGVVLTFVDITEVLHTRQRLVSSRQTTMDITQYMPAGLFIYSVSDDGDLVLESANPEAQRLTGISTQEYKGRRFSELWPRAEQQGIRKLFDAVMDSGQGRYMEEVQYRDERVEGSYRLQAFPLPERRLGVSFEDITTRIAVQKELKESEQRYRLLFETMAQGVVYQDCDGKITSANPAAQKILGLTLEQMQGLTSLDPRWKTIREDGTPLPGEEHPAMISLRTGKAVTGFIMGVSTPSFDKRRWILVNSIPQFHEGEKTPYQVYATITDITDKHALQTGEKN
ncbi:MAG: chemotaxis protein CheB [Desulfobacteraceae bacterium]